MNASKRKKRAKQKAKENRIYRNNFDGIIHTPLKNNMSMPTCIDVMTPSLMLGLSLISRR